MAPNEPRDETGDETGDELGDTAGNTAGDKTGGAAEDPAGDAARDQLSATFAALADPTRRAILARLAAKGEATVNDLAAPFPVSLQAVSKHLKVLEAAGLITRGRDAQYRPCRLRAEPLDDAAAWLENHRRQVEQRLSRLEDYLKDLTAAAGKSASPVPGDPTRME